MKLPLAPSPGVTLDLSEDPSARQARAAWPVALVTMPFALQTRPSMQLGLLAEIGRRHGFLVDTLHLNLDFARQLGPVRYHHLACTRNPMLGDWLFSVAAFGEDAPDPGGRLLEEFASLVSPVLERLAMSADEVRSLRETAVPSYLDALVQSVDWSRYRIVGFTSTFQQNAASFAMARRLKASYPELITVFGGANFDGPMGAAWMDAVPWIDYLISGEGDHAFPLLLERLVSAGDATAVPGVLARQENRIVVGPQGVPTENLDALPIPDYREYFDRSERLGLLRPSGVRDVDIPFESSRGCWWGEKSTCRFCGLNGNTMAYRAKSPTRVLEELRVLAQRHRSLSFNAADNILDRDYLRSVMAPLAAAQADYWLFYEVKANLSRDEIHLLHRAGVRALQPGIESLNTDILRIMRKGTTASQNVNLLRWARYYGIEVYWNLLLGFPGETEAQYEAQTRLVRSLLHLSPPDGSVRIGLERFSPYFEQSDLFPVREGRARPEPGYSHTYPECTDLDRAAYHFAGELDGSLPDESYEPLLRALRAWHDRWKSEEQPSLKFWWSPGLLQIEDRRSVLASNTYCFEDPLAALYVACSDRPISIAGLRARHRLTADDTELQQALEGFCDRGLMMRDGSLFLSLALPASTGR